VYGKKHVFSPENVMYAMYAVNNLTHSLVRVWGRDYLTHYSLMYHYW